MSELTDRSGRKWMTTRVKIAFVIAFAEGILVWVGPGFSRITVAAVAVAFIALHFAWGKNSSRRIVREITWVAAASQSLALILVILAWLVKVVALVLAVVLAVLALSFLLADRGGRR